MKKTTHFKTLREFVDSHPRTVRQGQIALKLGLSEQLLSAYLGGRVPGRGVALRLSREHHIDLEGLLDPDRGASRQGGIVTPASRQRERKDVAHAYRR